MDSNTPAFKSSLGELFHQDPLVNEITPQPAIGLGDHQTQHAKGPGGTPALPVNTFLRCPPRNVLRRGMLIQKRRHTAAKDIQGFQVFCMHAQQLLRNKSEGAAGTT